MNGLILTLILDFIHNTIVLEMSLAVLTISFRDVSGSRKSPSKSDIFVLGWPFECITELRAGPDNTH